jgi:hypothetical protein
VAGEVASAITATSCQRVGACDPGPQQLVLHAELADPLHRRGELAISGVRLALLQRPLKRSFGLQAPLLKLEERQAELAREQLNGLAAHQTQHHLACAPLQR